MSALVLVVGVFGVVGVCRKTWESEGLGKKYSLGGVVSGGDLELYGTCHMEDDTLTSTTLVFNRQKK